MPFATARTVSLNGALGHLVDVQADVSPGQPGLTLVGRADATLKEAHDRCRMAVINSRLAWPTTKRTTVLLSPADLLKRGAHYDLAIALAILAADGRIPPSALDRTLLVGELSISGGLRPAVGVLPMVLAARDRGLERVVVPEPQCAEAEMVPHMEVLGIRSLAQIVAVMRGDEVPEAPPVVEGSGSNLLTWRGDERLDELDLADLRGMGDAKFAVEVAAAGGHPILLSGPKGAGKTSLAERVPTLLPDLEPEESLELTAVHSLAGVLDPRLGMVRRPSFSAPHHDASKASVIGGGAGHVRPGEVSRAHCGVLFLDEFPLFRHDVVEALRQPLENGDITVARQEESVTLPARSLLVLACNPCPCGEFSELPGDNRCQCREVVRRDYRAKVSGPIADRIDITRHVLPLLPSDFAATDAVESSLQVRARVAAVRARQRRRFESSSWRLNGQIPAPRLRDDFAVLDDARAAIDEQLHRGRLSSRGAVRVQRLAWTVHDLRTVDDEGSETATSRPGAADVDVALRLRTGQPLETAVIEARLRRAADLFDLGPADLSGLSGRSA